MRRWKLTAGVLVSVALYVYGAPAWGSEKKVVTIPVVGGLCNCGQGGGGFDATYQGRNINVSFNFSLRTKDPVIIRHNNKIVPGYDGIASVCSWGMEAERCSITGKKAVVVGSWYGSTAFFASEVQWGPLQRPLFVSTAPKVRPATTSPTPLTYATPPLVYDTSAPTPSRQSVSTALPPPKNALEAVTLGCADRSGMTAGSNVTIGQVKSMSSCVDYYLGLKR